jgi:flavin reductase (DIM6/NTAB) family NADH-FMN oxidoreductase RutF
VFECKSWARYPGGDHVILVGEVEEMSTNANGKPLLFHAGRYGEIR